MIYLLIIIDILVNNFTKYTSLFFIIYLYNKKYKDYLLVGLILDLLIFHTFYNTLILSILFLLNKIFKELNKDNFYNYIFICIFNYLIYIILSNILLKTKITIMLTKIGKNLLINLIFYILSFHNIMRCYKHELNK